VVGLGAVAQAVHLPLLRKHPERFRIAALCDLSRATCDGVGARYGVTDARRFTRVEDMLDMDGLDAMAILTTGSHARLAAAAVSVGLAVFSEKPLAYSVEEIDELASRDPVLQLGYMKVYDPAVERAATILADRSPARSIEVTVLHPPSGPQLAHAGLLPAADDVGVDDLARLSADAASALERALGPAPRWLRDVYAEVLLGSVVHDLAVIRALAGSGLEVDDVDLWPTESPNGSLAVQARLPDGARVSIRWHYLEHYPAYREEVRVHGDRGTVSLDFAAPYLLYAPTVLTVVDADGEAERVAHSRSTVEAFERQWLAFEALVRESEQPRAGLEQGREDVLICQSAARVLAARYDVEIGGEAAAQVSELA
jgi:myo-inositol 2-dehydrogenase / D-chiro-inositol 1-dehydrogenase